MLEISVDDVRCVGPGRGITTNGGDIGHNKTKQVSMCIDKEMNKDDEYR